EAFLRHATRGGGSDCQWWRQPGGGRRLRPRKEKCSALGTRTPRRALRPVDNPDVRRGGSGPRSGDLSPSVGGGARHWGGERGPVRGAVRGRPRARRAMTDVTGMLLDIEQGDPQAAEQLLPLVYEELRRLAARKLAHEKPGQTLQATALVHEAYVRLVDVDE